jgi:pyrroline-5-carboxylate reductase
MTPILLIGAGRMGGALLQGWREAMAFPFDQLLIRCPTANPAVEAAVAAGATFNPPDHALRSVRTVLLAVKPQKWREAAPLYDALLAKEAVIVSVLVGVQAADISAGFGGRRVARAMPTTGVALARGVAALHANDPEALATAHRLFDPIATTVALPSEDLMDAAAAASGSAPAYLYAFVDALAEAGRANGLPAEAARVLARATVTSAAALLEASDAEPAELRRQVASPGGSTEAALGVLMGEGGIQPLLRDAVAAAVRRAQELARA